MIAAMMTLAVACVPRKDIEFRDISNIRLSLSGPKVTGDVLLYNPNGMAMKLKHADIDITIDGKSVGKLSQDREMRIEPRSEFTVPVEIALSLKDVGLFSTLGNIFSGKGLALRFTGSIKVAVHGITMNIPVDHVEQVKPGK